MATATVSIGATVTPGVTLSNPVSLDELQALGSPTVSVDSTATINNVVALQDGHYEIVDSTVNLTSAYNRLAALSLSSSNRATLILLPDYYTLPGSSDFEWDTDYVDIIGLGPRGSVQVANNLITGNEVTISASDFNIQNVHFINAVAFSGVGTTGKFRNCRFDAWGNQSIGHDFEDCYMFDIGKSSSHVTLSGTIDGCKLGGSNTVYLGSGAIMRYCVAEPTVNAAAAINAKVYHCALKAALGGNITNDIGTPYNVVDSDVAV